MTKRKQLTNIALMVLFLVYFTGVFTGTVNKEISAAAGAVVLVLNLPYIGKTFRWPVRFFCAAGVLILLVGKAPLSQWIYGLNAMAKTIVILIAVQTLSIAIKLGNYENAVTESLNSGITSVSVFFSFLVLLTHLLAGIMSLGSVVVILTAVMPAIKGRLDQERRFVVQAITVGYCTLFLWAPGTVTVLMSMQVFDLSWGEYFLPAFSLAILGLVMGCIWGYFRFRNVSFRDVDSRKTCSEGAGRISDTKVSWNKDLSRKSESTRKLLEMLLAMILIVFGITILEKLGVGDATGRMIVVSVMISSVWLLLLTRRRFISLVPKVWWKEKLSGGVDLYSFFLSMGIFSAAVSYSGFEGWLVDFCSRYHQLFEIAVLPLLPLVIITLSLVGIHPFISVLIIGPILMGLELPVFRLQLGLAMSLGCCLSYMVSPFAGLILTLSDHLKLSPAEICFKYNLQFAVLYYFAGLIFIWMIGVIL